jgi:hypothetical protein
MKEIFITAWVIVTLVSADHLLILDDVSYDLKVSVGVEDDGRQRALKVGKAVKAHVLAMEARAPWVKQYRHSPDDFSFAIHFKLHETTT